MGGAGTLGVKQPQGGGQRRNKRLEQAIGLLQRLPLCCWLWQPQLRPFFPNVFEVKQRRCQSQSRVIQHARESA